MTSQFIRECVLNCVIGVVIYLFSAGFTSPDEEFFKNYGTKLTENSSNILKTKQTRWRCKMSSLIVTINQMLENPPKLNTKINQPIVVLNAMLKVQKTQKFS